MARAETQPSEKIDMNALSRTLGMQWKELDEEALARRRLPVDN